MFSDFTCNYRYMKVEIIFMVLSAGELSTKDRVVFAGHLGLGNLLSLLNE